MHSIKQKMLFFLTALCVIAPAWVYADAGLIPDQETPHTITLFMAPIDPYNLKDKYPLNAPLLQRPDKVTRAIFKAQFNQKRNTTNQGLFVTYAGMSNVFDSNGQVVFPRKHQKDSILLLVTQNVKPVIIRGNTVNFFVRDDNYPVAYYELTRHFDPINQIYYWETHALPIPADPKIPASAMVLIAKPDEIYVPEGTTLALGGANLLLPTLYPTQKFMTHKNNNALFFLKINSYFAPVRFSYKISKERYAQMIT